MAVFGCGRKWIGVLSAGWVSLAIAEIGVSDVMALLILRIRLVADLVWSDPINRFGGFPDSRRGSGTLFGRGCFETFLRPGC
jgi:hypothetical protein